MLHHDLVAKLISDFLSFLSHFSYREELLKVLRGFLSHHIHVHQGSVLHCLESVAVLHPDLVTKLIPDCSRIIGQSETKRGVGVDSQLR